MTQSLWTDEWAQLPVLAAAGLALLVGLLGGALIALARHRRHGEVLLALKTRLAVAEDQAGRLPRLEQELARKSERLGLLQAECAELKARLEHERPRRKRSSPCCATPKPSCSPTSTAWPSASWTKRPASSRNTTGPSWTAY